jgi:transcriptional regulator with XRE-family HTH domain
MSVPPEVQAFGAEARRRRESLGWTLSDLATRSGLTPNYLGSVELGIRDPSLSTMEKIANGFDVPLMELLGTDELSPAALEFVRLLKEAKPDVQEAIGLLLTFLSGKQR